MDEQSIFLNALDKSTPEERAEWLDEACGDDDSQKKRIAQLLRRHEEARSFLEKPAPGLEQTIIGDASDANLAASLDAGLARSFDDEAAVVIGDVGHSILRALSNSLNEVPRVSLRESEAEGADPIARPSSPEIPDHDSDTRYRLDGEIARGGMGAIIKGRDTDLGRDLAIKVLLDSHKDKPDVIQRFVEEAQIGGQLQHPGITPIYELGQFADQRPFFAMKLVKGETLSKLLSDREDAIVERGKFVGIFEQVCQTMAYAHARGVIHRDLKPANIMVGAFGEVQVMDWGLAKVLPSGGVADEQKARQQQQGTSVIQTMRSAGSDTPGSLGSAGSETQMGSVMGTPAYMPPEQALGEIDQLDQRADVFGLGAILCEILTGQAPYVGDDGTQIYRMASRGRVDDALARLDACEADAELIALTKRCLELEPADRPADAGVLAESISGYLESVETKLRETELAKVDAQVRAEELKRRHKLMIAAGTAIVATLVVGVSVSAWQAVRATRAEERTAEALVEVSAERDAKEVARKDAEDVSKFLGDVFHSPDPTRDGRDIKVAELLDVAAKKLDNHLVDQPARRARLQDTLGRTYHALGLYKQAIRLGEQVRDYHLAASGRKHCDTLAAMNNLANYYHKAGRRGEALKQGEKTLALSRTHLGPGHHVTHGAMTYLAGIYYALGRRDEALKLREDVLTLCRRHLGIEHPGTVDVMNNLAISYDAADRRDEALKLREKVLMLKRKQVGAEHPDTLVAMGNVAISYDATGRQDAAMKLREKVLTLRRKVLGAEHPETLHAMSHVAVAYQAAGRLDEALKLHAEAVRLFRKKLGPQHKDTLSSLHNLAAVYHATGQLEEAIRLFEELIVLRRKLLGPEHPRLFSSMTGLAACYQSAGRREDALKLHEEVLTLRRKVLGPEHSETFRSMHNLAVSLHAAGRLDDALKLNEDVLRIGRKVLGPEHPDTLSAMSNLAASYDSAGRRDEAIKLNEEVLTLRRQLLGVGHPQTLMSMSNLATSYEAVSRLDEARQLREEFFAIRPDDPHNLNGMAWQLVARPDEEGRYPKAKQAVIWARKATQLAPHDGALQNTLGVALYRIEQWREAIDALRKSVQRGFDVPHNWLFIAMSHWQLEEKDKAKVWYDKSLAWQYANAAKTDSELQGFYAEAGKLMTADKATKPQDKRQDRFGGQ